MVWKPGEDIFLFSFAQSLDLMWYYTRVRKSAALFELCLQCQVQNEYNCSQSSVSFYFSPHYFVFKPGSEMDLMRIAHLKSIKQSRHVGEAKNPDSLPNIGRYKWLPFVFGQL